MKNEQKELLNVDYSELTEKEVLQLIHQEAIKQNINAEATIKTLKRIKSNTDLFAWVLIIAILLSILGLFIR